MCETSIRVRLPLVSIQGVEDKSPGGFLSFDVFIKKACDSPMHALSFVASREAVIVR